MKCIVVFLLLLACALCAVAQTQVSLTVSNPVALAGAPVTLNATVSGTPTSAMPTSTIPTGTITFEDGTTPFGQATLSSSLGLATGDFFTSSLSAALLPAISLIVLLSGIVTGCSSSSTSLNPLAATPTPPGTQVFEVITSTTADSQIVGQDTWITVNVLPAS